MTHVKALEAGQSSQGSSEPITPGLLLLVNYRQKTDISLFDAKCLADIPLT